MIEFTQNRGFFFQSNEYFLKNNKTIKEKKNIRSFLWFMTCTFCSQAVIRSRASLKP
uniref:Uncharacterized protein n=1 Tax=Anguilla anguilla TaxID=7936 RepID=A0A0E9S512_ANGAN